MHMSLRSLTSSNRLPPDIFRSKVTESLLVYQTSLTGMQHIQQIYPPEAVLSAEELKRAKRSKLQKVKEHFVSGRIFMRLVLAQHLSIPVNAIELCTTKLGKPIQLHCQNLHFNLSGTADLFAIAISYAGEVGIDIEQHRPRKNLNAIAQTALSRSEHSSFCSCSIKERELFFYRAWSLKEATFKADGRGLTLPLDSIGFTYDICVSASEWNNDLGDRRFWEWFYHRQKNVSLAIAVKMKATDN